MLTFLQAPAAGQINAALPPAVELAHELERTQHVQIVAVRHLFHDMEADALLGAGDAAQMDDLRPRASPRARDARSRRLSERLTVLPLTRSEQKCGSAHLLLAKSAHLAGRALKLAMRGVFGVAPTDGGHDSKHGHAEASC